MQGWRNSQEDAHITCTDMPDGVCLFGVFDGHGGLEVSNFVKEKFVSELIKLDEYKNGQYDEALRKCFRRMDEIMLEPEGCRRIT